MTARDFGLLLALSLLWGGSFFFVEILVEDLPVMSLVTARVGLAALLLWSYVIIRRVPLPRRGKHWAALLGIGFLNNALPFCLIAWGQTRIDSGLASILNATTPFFTILVAAALIADERPSANKWGGVALGLVGVAVLIGPKALQGMSGEIWGQLAVMGAALSYALAAAYARRFKRWGMSPLIVATGQVSAATLMLLPFAIQSGGLSPFLTLSIQAWLALAGLALLSTAVAYILYFRLIASAGATNAALVTLLIPVSAILLGVAFLDESLTGAQLAGMTLIGIGLIVIDGRWKRAVARA